MTLQWLDFALVVGIVVVGCATSYFLLLRKLRRVLAQNQRDAERRLSALTDAIRLTTTLSKGSATGALAAAKIEEQPAAIPAPAVQLRVAGVGAEPDRQEVIPPQIQAAIAAAAIAAFGNHARVRSARRIPSSDVVSPWTQQGRVIVQSSHNLRTQGLR